MSRAMALAGGLTLMGLLATARFLDPSPAGLGTHRQLGLPPCTMILWTGRPCPSCGMTTSWAHLTRGQFFQAVQANVGGLLLGILAVGIAPWLFVSAVRGRWLGAAPAERTMLIVAGVVVAVTILDWLRKGFLQ